jgi:gas vesicle protein
MMSFMKGMAVGIVAGAIAGVVLTPKPKKFGMRLKKTASKAARNIGDMVDNIISVFD